MKDLIWDESLSVDVQEVDEDHQKLMELYNILKHSVEKGDTKDYIDSVMEELISCTVWHFKHEERLMLKHAYDGLEEHKKEHQELINTGIAFHQKIQKEGKNITNADIEFLEHWLIGHILGTDMKMGSFLGEFV